MLFHAISAYSEASAVAAISAAVGEASADFSRDAKSVHIIVSSVFKVGDGWKAIVQVIVEPDLEEKLDKHLEKNKKLEQHYDKKLKNKDLEDGRDFPRLEFDEPITYVHFPSVYEEFYDHYIAQEPEVYAHLIEEGPLWDSIQKVMPDIDFYEAAHKNQLEARHEVDSRQFQDNLKNLELIRKQKVLLKELELDS